MVENKKRNRLIGAALVFLFPIVDVSKAGTLKFDGEIRERFETLDGMNKKTYGDASLDFKGNVKGESDDRLLLQRMIAGFTYDQNENITYKFHFYDARVWGWSLGEDDFVKNRGTTDEYVMDSHEEYFELFDAYAQIRNLLVDGFTATLGRQKIWYGDKRIFGPGGWGNSIGWLWDAGRFSYNKEGNSIDVWYGQTRTKDPDSFSLTDKHAYQGVGLYAHHGTTENGGVEPFFAWKNNLFHQTAPEDNLYYYGARLYETDFHGINYDFTLSMETGDSGANSVDAYGYVAKAGYRFRRIPGQPNLVIGRVFASGDNDPGDGTVRTYTRPFGSTDGEHYGRMDMMNWSNMEDNQINLHLDLSKTCHLKLSYHNFNLNQSEDKWGYYKYSNLGGNRDTHIGNEYDLQFKYRCSKRLEVQAIYAYFDAGDFVVNNVADNDAHRFFFQCTYKFGVGL